MVTVRAHKKHEPKGTFGKSLAAIRIERNMPLRILSEITGIHVCQLTGYENRGVHPKYECLIALADALEVDLDTLCGRRKPRRYHYVLRPGYVISINDGDRHFIGFYHLQGLYKLAPSMCTHIDQYSKLKVPPGTEVIHLGPREQGDYEQHLQHMKAVADHDGQK